MKTVLKYKGADGNWYPFTGDVPAPTSSIVVKGGVIGAIDGTNAAFNVGYAYIAGTLQVYVNGVAQSEFIAETNPAGGVFTLSEAPFEGSSIKAYFHVANTGVGNADSLGGQSLTTILQSIFPVGSKYDSGESPTLPPLIASIGTWERFKGRVVVGVDEDQSEFDTVGERGGTKSETLVQSNLPKLTGSLGLHGGEGGSQFVNGTGVFAGADIRSGYKAPASTSGGSQSIYTSIPFTLNGNTQTAVANLQPYETTYMWKRIA